MMKFMDKLKSIGAFGGESNDASKRENLDVTDVKKKMAGSDSKRYSSSSPSLLLASTVTASGSSEHSAADKDMIDFTISIEAIDGIIVTSSTAAKITRLGTTKKAEDELNMPPVFSLVTYQHSAGAHGNLKTNIPSRQLVKSKSSIGRRERYYAYFGSSGRSRKKSDKKLDQIKITMPMRKNKSRPSGYVEKKLDLSVGLMRGSEVIKLGSACVALHGDECGESKLVPVVQEQKEKSTNTARLSRNRSITRKPKTILGARSVCFSSDPSRKYSIQCANLRLSVKANYRPVTKPTSLGTNLVEDEKSILSKYLPIGQESAISVKVVQSSEEGSNGFEMIENNQRSLSYRDSLFDNLSRASMSLTTDRSPIASKDEDESHATTSHASVESEEDYRSISTSTSNESSGVSYTDDESHHCDDTATLGEESTFIDNISLGTIKKFRELGYGQETFKGI